MQKIIKCHCKILLASNKVCLSNIDCALFPTHYAISYLYVSPICCRRASTSFHFLAGRLLVILPNPSQVTCLGSLTQLQMEFNAPCAALAQCLTHTFWRFSHLCCLSLDISLSSWTVSSWTRVKDQPILFLSVGTVPAQKVNL